MSEAEIINHAQQALLLVLTLSLPSIAVVSIVGILIGLVQALTQIQEQTVSFALKLIALVAMLMLTAGWMGSGLISYASISFARIEDIFY